MTATDTASRSTLWALGQGWASRRPHDDVIAWSPEASADPGTVGVVDWSRLLEATSLWRRRLSAIGATDGQVVLLALPNSPITVSLWLAVMANGAVAQSIDADSGTLAIERAVRQTEPVAVLACAANAAVVGRSIQAVGGRTRLLEVDVRAPLDSATAVDGLGRLGSEPGDPDPDAVAALLPTSGTSGAPKLVEVTHRSYVMGAERLARNAGFLASDRHYLCSPFFHTNAQVYLVAPPFVTGGSMAIVPRFSARSYFSAASSLGATVASMVAPPLRLALQSAAGRGDHVDAGPLRLVQYGMSLSAADWAHWDRLVPQIETRQIYGQTESITGVLGGSPWEPDDRRTIGRPYIGVPAVRLVGDDGSDVPDGEPGELWVAGEPGSTLMRGYRGAPEATAEALVDGVWLRTGDIMVRGTDGRFAFRGRRMHIIRRGGENLSTYALEADLQACPLVTDVAVTAKADERLDALVIAHVIPAAGFSEDAFLAWCRETLGRRGTPDEVRVRTEFPRTPSGRVIARELG